MQNLGEQLSEEEIETLINDVDIDNPKQVKQHIFIYSVRKNKIRCGYMVYLLCNIIYLICKCL